MNIETKIFINYSDSKSRIKANATATIYINDIYITINKIAILERPDGSHWISLYQDKYINKEGKTQYSDIVILSKYLKNELSKQILSDYHIALKNSEKELNKLDYETNEVKPGMYGNKYNNPLVAEDPNCGERPPYENIALWDK